MTFQKYFTAVAGMTVLSVILFALPLMMFDVDIGRSYIAGIPPQLFITLSWVGGYAYAVKNCPDKTFALTLGFMPIRLLVELSWFYLLMQISDVNIGIAIGSAIMHFALFTIPQIMCISHAMDSLRKPATHEPCLDS